jgi:hypothetical protein
MTAPATEDGCLPPDSATACEKCAKAHASDPEPGDADAGARAQWRLRGAVCDGRLPELPAEQRGRLRQVRAQA